MVVLPWAESPRVFGRDNQSWFTAASAMHLFMGAILQALGERYCKPFCNHLFVFLNVGHWLEDLLENTGVFSLEHIFSEIIECKHKLWLAKTDNDSMQNHIGDILAFFLGSSFAFFGGCNQLTTPELWLFLCLLLFAYSRICLLANSTANL